MEKKYGYRAIDLKGNKLKGVLLANNISTANKLLRATGLIPLDIREKKYYSLFNKNALLKLLQYFGLRLYNNRDLMILCNHLSVMLNSGVSIIQAFRAISVQVDNSYIKARLNSVASSIEQGNSLTNALNEEQGFFPPLLVNMVDAGETGGKLDLMLAKLSDHYEKQHDLEQKIRSATAYPLFVTIISAIVVSIMVLFVLPQFASIFDATGMHMPVFSRILLTAGEIIINYRYYLMVFILFLFIASRHFCKTKKGRLSVDRLRLNLPLYGKIYRYIVTARFARTLGTLLAAGVSMHLALNLADKVINNTVISDSINNLGQALSNGETMAAPMSADNFFSPLLVEMVRVGEETGSLDQTLVQAALFYEKEVSYVVERLGSLLEPILLLVVGLFIGVLVFSILSPMYQIFELV